MSKKQKNCEPSTPSSPFNLSLSTESLDAFNPHAINSMFSPLVSSETSLVAINPPNLVRSTSVQDSLRNQPSIREGMNTGRRRGVELVDGLVMKSKSNQLYEIRIETPATVNLIYNDVKRFCEDTHVGENLEFMIRDAFVDGIFDEDPSPKTKSKHGHHSLERHPLPLQFDTPSGLMSPSCTTSEVASSRYRLRSVRESSVPDSYDANLHAMFCLSVRGLPSSGATALTYSEEHMMTDETVVPDQPLQVGGLIFWRELTAADMQKWLLPDTAASIQDAYVEQRDRHDHHLAEMGDEEETQLVPVTSPEVDRRLREGKTVSILVPPTQVGSSILEHWVKIELVCTHPTHYGQGLGTMLLSAALLAAATRKQEHCILHVAGGVKNVPATKLYTKFGFNPVDGEATFKQPNKDLFVLLDVVGALETVDWASMGLQMYDK